MRFKIPIISASCAICAIAAGMLAADPPLRISIKQPFEAHNATKGGKPGNTQIVYHQGPVMTGAPVSAYVIYYGAVDSGTQHIVNQFFSDLSSSPEYAVNSTYTDSAGARVATHFYFNPFDYAASGSSTGSLYQDSGASQGTSLGSNTIPAIVHHAIQTGGLPADRNGVYFVITAADIKVAGFCKSFCAYHTSSTSIVSNTPIRYALIPDPGQACTGCDGNFSLNQNITPNGNPGADEMTDSIIHELSESVTDPDGGGWYASGGAENGDLCNYVYGSSLKKVPAGYPGAGAFYNFSPFAGHYYLVQQIWSNIAPQACLAAPR